MQYNVGALLFRLVSLATSLYCLCSTTVGQWWVNHRLQSVNSPRFCFMLPL